jgi:hypothetical protein
MDTAKTDDRTRARTGASRTADANATADDPTTAAGGLGGALGRAVLDAIGEIPHSERGSSHQPKRDSLRAANLAASKAALAAGALALPLGPVGWLTVLPEMVTVWRLQARLVADIAALHGRSADLSHEALLYCLFQHSSGQVLRDLMMRVGERSAIQTLSVRALQVVAAKVGAMLAQKAVGRSMARWLPIAGAVGLGAYALWDTRQVAATAISLFERPALPPPA